MSVSLTNKITWKTFLALGISSSEFLMFFKVNQPINRHRVGVSIATSLLINRHRVGVSIATSLLIIFQSFGTFPSVTFTRKNVQTLRDQRGGGILVC